MSSKLKARLLHGARHTETLYVPEFESDDCGGESEDCDGIVTVRALTDGEMAEVTAAKLDGQVVRGAVGKRPTDQEVRVADSAVGQMRGRRIAAAFGLSVDGEKWTPSEVAKLPSGAVKRIARKVDELSGDDGLADDAAKFRGDSRGSVDGDSAPDGDAAGDDAG